MRLVRVADRGVWEVLAVEKVRAGAPEGSPGESAWSHLVEEGENRHAIGMRAIIGGHVPMHGPPRDRNKCTPLRDGIFEFKRGPKRGPKLRVLFFYDEGRVVICTQAFWKDRDTAPDEINRAVLVRREYLHDKREHKLFIRDPKTGKVNAR